jgi:hypothetical protein
VSMSFIHFVRALVVVVGTGSGDDESTETILFTTMALFAIASAASATLGP